MHLTQQQQLNQMCPPPLGPPTAWFMSTQPSGFPPPSTTSISYHNYHHHQSNNNSHPHQTQPQQHSQHHNPHLQNQNYYNVSGGSIAHPQTNATTTTAATSISSLAISTTNLTLPQQDHSHHHQHQQQQQHLHQHHQQQAAPQYNSYAYHQSAPQLQQHQNNQQQQYNQIHHQQPLTLQQPSQSQHVHQQPSPLLQQAQSQLSPHTTSQPRPSPTIHHQQPSPNYQQRSPHLTSPSLQPSPSLHHSAHHQPSPVARHQQQTPPHHTPTPLSQHHNSRPASVKETSSSAPTPNTNIMSNISQTEVRILEFNRRLQCRPTTYHRNNPLPSHDRYDDLKWWEEFINEFFKDDATLTLVMQIDEKPTLYSLRRALITKFFRSYFDGGATELSINLKNSKEFRSGQSIVLECEFANISSINILKHPKINTALRVVVCTEGHLTLDFVNNGVEPLLIRSWKFRVHLNREYIERTNLGLPSALLVEPITFHGLPSSTISYLRMCAIMDPMQELMAQQKQANIEPRACLKKYLFEKYRYMSEDDNKAAANKRRKRRQPASPSVKATSSYKKSKNSTIIGNNLVSNITSPSVANPPTWAIVGEPSLICDYLHDNERYINRVENHNHVVAEEFSNKQEENFVVEAARQLELSEAKEENEMAEHEIETVIQEDSKSVQEEPAKKAEPTNDVTKEVGESNQDDKLALEEDEPTLLNDEPSRPVSEEPSEKENNINEETQTNSTATQSDSHFNIMSSIPEDREDNCKSTSSDSAVSKLPPSSSSKGIMTNGSSNKQNRRRSSERKETLREGLMRTSDFVVAMKDLKCEHPSLWRITTGNNLLQQFEPKTQNGVVLYENTNQYAGWNPEIKRDYVGVDVRLTQHTRNQITVERILLNFQKLEDPEAFYDKHFAIYLQILISTALDPKFWESIEGEPKHHDYFVTSRKIIEDTMKRYKQKLAIKLKLSESSIKDIEKYPNLLVKPTKQDAKAQICRACNTNLSTQIMTFENKSYDLHSFKLVKVTGEHTKSEDKDQQNNLCDGCVEIVKLYSQIHHMGWSFYNFAREKIEQHRAKNKAINTILDECLKDEDWIAKIYFERDALWLKVDQIQ